MPLRLIALLALLVIPATAQDAKKKGDIQVSLLAEKAPPSLGKVFLLAKDVKSASVELPTNHLSDPVAVSERQLVLKTEEKEITLCPITLPEAGKSFAIVLVTARPSGFKPIIVRTDDPSFKAGDVLFINRSDKAVLCKLGTTPLTVKPGESAKSRPSGAIDNTYYDIAFATHEEKGDKLLSSTRWPIDNNLRSYLFFFNDARGRVSYRAVDEPIPVVKP